MRMATTIYVANFGYKTIMTTPETLKLTDITELEWEELLEDKEVRDLFTSCRDIQVEIARFHAAMEDEEYAECREKLESCIAQCQEKLAALRERKKEK